MHEEEMRKMQRIGKPNPYDRPDESQRY